MIVRFTTLYNRLQRLFDAKKFIPNRLPIINAIPSIYLLATTPLNLIGGK
jgi:hypothetical protein